MSEPLQLGVHVGSWDTAKVSAAVDATRASAK